MSHFDPNMPDIPQEVMDGAIKIERWAKTNGHTLYQLSGVCDRQFAMLYEAASCQVRHLEKQVAKAHKIIHDLHATDIDQSETIMAWLIQNKSIRLHLEDS